MAIERRLTEIVGPVGGKLHTARSRNDQVATDVAMFVRAHAEEAGAAHRAAGRHPCVGWPSATSTGRCPATPTCSAPSPCISAITCWPTCGCWSATASGFGAVVAATAELPLGAGALAGVNFDTDRRAVAAALGFAGVAENSIDAVSNRDFVLDYLAAAATCATHLSRLGRRDRAVVQRGVRLLRGLRRLGLRARRSCPRRRTPTRPSCCGPRRPRVVGRPGRAARGDARSAADLQQGHAGGQGAPVRRLRHARAVPRRGPTGCSRRSPSTASGWPRRPPTSSWPPPTSPTCWSAAGVPFREAHGVVAGLVRRARRAAASRCRSSRRDELAEQSPLLDDEFYRAARATARGLSRRCPRAGPAWRASASSSSAPGPRWRS